MYGVEPSVIRLFRRWCQGIAIYFIYVLFWSMHALLGLCKHAQQPRCAALRHQLPATDRPRPDASWAYQCQQINTSFLTPLA